jgi:hypothetical protein
MEADWEFEVGGDAPLIDAAWNGLVDLRVAPERVRELAEVAEFPALGVSLTRLNGAGSPVWTSKCDLWPAVDRTDWDADELDAPPERASHAMGCYIDLMPAGDVQWTTPEMAAASCKRFRPRLNFVPIRCCRVDLVIRRAIVGGNQMEFGVTAYLTSCGATADDAAGTLGAALDAFTGAVLAAWAPA